MIPDCIEFRAYGGPYDMCRLALSCGGTAPFKVTGYTKYGNPKMWYGYYDRNMKWVSLATVTPIK